MPKPSNSEISVYEIIQKIKNGLLDPKTFSKHTRRLCVEALYMDGKSDIVIAGFLKCSDRTIRRDKQAIIELNGLTLNSETTMKLIKKFTYNSDMHHDFIMRQASSRDCTPLARSQIVFLAHRVDKERFEILQTLGILPNRAPGPRDNLLFNQEVEQKSVKPYIEDEMAKMFNAMDAMERQALCKELEKLNNERDENSKELIKKAYDESKRKKQR